MKEKPLNTEGLDAFEIYNYLPKINCKRCGENTCLAFASKVEHGLKKINQCLIINK